MARWLVLAVVLGGVLAGSSCGGESVIGSGGFGGDLILSGGSGPVGGTGAVVSVGGSGGISNGTGGSGGTQRGPLGTCDNGMGGCGSIDASGCDLQEALDKSCARAGCHSSVDRYGSLDLSDPLNVASQMVDRQAPHTDINCAAVGMPFRACTPDELSQFCPGSTAGVKLIDSANPQESWVLRKLGGTQGMCGYAMPMAPGNSVNNGWNDARRTCLERFFLILAAEGQGTGGAGGAGGSTGGVGAEGAGAQGAFGGTGGSIEYTPSCDLPVAFSKSCARTGCHSALDAHADLDFSILSNIPAMLLDQPARHGDINCASPGMPFRECQPSELPAACPPNALLVDSANPDESWVIKKLRGESGCGDPMPLPPGNSVTSGWDAARQQCLEDYFYWIASSKADSPPEDD
jgi:hypothetical protein